MTLADQHIVVLMGGRSAERAISLQSGEAALAALQSRDLRASALDAQADVVAQLQALAPDIVLNCLHGTGGEDGRVQGILEWLEIPYTHSGVLASALAMDKPRAKKMFLQAGLPVAEHIEFAATHAPAEHPLPCPYVLKPTQEGSSVDVYIVQEEDAPPSEKILSNAPRAGNPRAGNWMAEAYVPGRELSCAVLGGAALDVIELVVREGFYDYRAKYEDGATEHILPAALTPELAAIAKAHSEAAYRALGCRGVARVDFRYDEEGLGLIVLELNTQPGLTPLSLVPEIAARGGMDFAALLEWMLEDASCSR